MLLFYFFLGPYPKAEKHFKMLKKFSMPYDYEKYSWSCDQKSTQMLQLVLRLEEFSFLLFWWVSPEDPFGKIKIYVKEVLLWVLIIKLWLVNKVWVVCFLLFVELDQISKTHFGRIKNLLMCCDYKYWLTSCD